MTAKQRKEAEAIERIKAGLKCSDEEAREIYETDKAIDQGALTAFDLTSEQEAVARQYTRAGTRTIKAKTEPEAEASGKRSPTVYKWDSISKRKPDETKVAIVTHLAEAAKQFCGIVDVQITNPAQTFDFTLDNESYYVTLTKRRKTKGK